MNKHEDLASGPSTHMKGWALLDPLASYVALPACGELAMFSHSRQAKLHESASLGTIL